MSAEAPVTWQSVGDDAGRNALMSEYGSVLDRIDNALLRLSEDMGVIRDEQVISNARMMAILEALSR